MLDFMIFLLSDFDMTVGMSAAVNPVPQTTYFLSNRFLTAPRPVESATAEDHNQNNDYEYGFY